MENYPSQLLFLPGLRRTYIQIPRHAHLDTFIYSTNISLMLLCTRYSKMWNVWKFLHSIWSYILDSHTRAHTHTPVTEESIVSSILHLVMWLLTNAASHRPKQGMFWNFGFSRLKTSVWFMAIRGQQESDGQDRHNFPGRVLVSSLPVFHTPVSTTPGDTVPYPSFEEQAPLARISPLSWEH